MTEENRKNAELRQAIDSDPAQKLLLRVARDLMQEMAGLRDFVKGHCEQELIGQRVTTATLEKITQSVERTQQVQQEMVANQNTFTTEIKVIKTDLRDVKQVILPLQQSVAVHQKDLADADKSIDQLFSMVGDTRDRIRAIQPDGKKKDESGWPDALKDNVKWIIIGCCIIAGMAYGVITHDNVAEVLPIK